MQIKRFFKHLTRHITRSAPFLSLIGTMAGTYVWLVGKTSHFEVEGITEFEELIKKHNGGIFVSWHGRALLLPYFWSNPRPMKALVSPHADGRIIARLLNMFHIKTIDGSTDRNSRSSAIEILKELKKGTVVSLISDGPRGPSMRLNKSVIYFAQKTGKPIMGFTYSAEKSKIMRKSWDDMLLPPLFGKGYIKATTPLFVPENATEEELEQLRQTFENELNAQTFSADKLCHLPEIAPDHVKKDKLKKERN